MVTYLNTRKRPLHKWPFGRDETRAKKKEAVSPRRNRGGAGDRYQVAAMALLKTYVFLLLGLLPRPSGTILAALRPLVWLIGVPCRVNGCS